MASVQSVLDALDQIAPFRHALPDDPVGLNVGDPRQEVLKVLVTLDASLPAIAEAVRSNCQLIVAHHPVLYRPAKSINRQDHTGQRLVELIRNDIACIAAHTNWDAAIDGVSETMANMLHLMDLQPGGTGSKLQQLKLVTFVPESSIDSVLEAVSKAGAGVIGEYSRCAFVSSGTGTYDASPSARPMAGHAGERNAIPEFRIEIVLSADARSQVEQALIQAHPYDQPAYDFLLTADRAELPLGRIGTLPEPQSLANFELQCERVFKTKCRTVGEPGRLISRVYVAGGAADSDWPEAMKMGADVMVCGEVRHHNAVEASDLGFALIEAGHFATEHCAGDSLARRLSEMLPDLDLQVFCPKPGDGGRPI